MRIKREKKQTSVPLFSTSDIAFLLLIFIMLVSLINYRKSVNIEYAEAESARVVSAERNLEVWVDRQGNYYLEGNFSSLIGVEHGIIEAYRINPDTRVHLIADRDTPFLNVHEVLEVLQLLEHRLVSFVVKNE